ncbi:MULTISPECIES: hypothetical protein [unclassified Streptomyces]
MTILIDAKNEFEAAVSGLSGVGEVDRELRAARCRAIRSGR